MTYQVSEVVIGARTLIRTGKETVVSETLHQVKKQTAKTNMETGDKKE